MVDHWRLVQKPLVFPEYIILSFKDSQVLNSCLCFKLLLLRRIIEKKKNITDVGAIAFEK